MSAVDQIKGRWSLDGMANHLGLHIPERGKFCLPVLRIHDAGGRGPNAAQGKTGWSPRREAACRGNDAHW